MLILAPNQFLALLSPDNGTTIRLTDTDNAIITASGVWFCTFHIFVGKDGAVPISSATTNWVTVWAYQAGILSASAVCGAFLILPNGVSEFQINCQW